MAEFDGSIKLGVTLSPKDSKKVAEDLKRELAGTLNSSVGKETNKQLQQVEKTASSLYTRVDKVVNKMTEMEHTKLPSDEFKLAEKEATKYSNEIDKLIGKRKRLLETLYEEYEYDFNKKGGSPNNPELTPRKYAEMMIPQEIRYREINAEIEKFGTLLDHAEDRMLALEQSGRSFKDVTDTAKYKDAAADLNNLISLMELQKRKAEEIIDKERGASGMDAERIAHLLRLRLNATEADSEIIQLNKSLRAQEAELQRLTQLQKDMEAAKLGLGYKQYDDVVIKIAQVRSEIEQTKTELSDYQSQLEDTTPYKGLLATMKELPQHLANGVRGIGQLAKRGAATMFRSMGEGAKHAVKHISGLVKNLAKLTAQRLKKGFSNIVDGIKNIGKQSKSSEFSFKKLGRTLLKYGLGVRSLFFLFRRLRAGVAEGIKNLVQFNGGANDTNRAVSALVSSLQYLKNAWAAGFAPIINFVGPWLSQLIDLLARAGNALGAFVSALTGKATFIRAKKVQQDYAKSLMGTAGAADKAKEALASYDKLEVIQQDNDSGSGGAGDINDMFEEVNVDDALPKKIMDWIQSIKDAWAEGNFFEVGRLIAEGLNEAIYAIDDWFNNVLRPKGVEWAGNFAEIINGFVFGFDWSALGKTVADGMNAIADIINTFLTGVGWVALGSGIGTAIKSWFDNIEWDLIGQTFANGWNALIDTIYGIVTTPGLWESIGTSISTFITSWFNTIHWEELAASVVAGINGIILALQTALDKTDFNSMAERLTLGINTIINGINWSGLGTFLSTAFNKVIGAIRTAINKFDWKGAGKGIDTGLRTTIDGIKWDDVGKTISDFFDGALDALLEIDWLERSRQLTDGFDEMIANIEWSKLIAKLALLLGELAISAVDATFSITGSILAELLKVLGDFFEALGLDGVAGFFHGMSEAMREAVQWLRDNIFTPIMNALKKLFGINSPSTVFRDEIGKPLIAGMLEGIKQTWVNITKFFGEKLTALKESIAQKWEQIKSSAQTKWDSIKSAVGTKVESMKSTVQNKFNTIKSAISGKWDEIKSNTGTKLGELKTSVSDKMNNIKTMLNNMNWANIGTNLVNGLKQGITDAWNGLKTKVGNLAEGLTNKIKNAWDVRSPSRVWAQIGEYLDEGLWQGLDAGESELMKKVNSLASMMTDGLDLQVPAIAKGAVLPVTESFNKAVQGNPDSANSQSNESVSREPIQFILDKKVLAQAVWDEEQKQYKMYNGYVPRMAT